MSQLFLDILCKHSFKVLLLPVIIVLALSTGLKHFKFDSDFRSNFTSNNSHLLALESLENTYTKAETSLIVLKAKDGDLFTENALNIIEYLTSEAWKIPNAIRAESITNHQHTESKNDEMSVDSLYSSNGNYNAADLQELKHIATSNKNLVRRLISANGEVAAINVTLNLDETRRRIETDQSSQATIKLVKSLLSDQSEFDTSNIDIYLNGTAITSTAVAEQAMEDMTVLVPLSYLLIYGLLWFLVGSLSAVIATWVLTALSLLGALGAASYMGITMTVVSISTMNIMITICIAHCVHIYSAFFNEYRQGVPKKIAIAESFKLNFRPICLTSFTTIIGFLSMNLSDIPTNHDLGNITAMGVAIAFILSQTFIPAFLLLIPLPKTTPLPERRLSFATLSTRYALWLVKHCNAVFIFSLTLAIGLFLLSSTNIISDRLSETIKHPHKLRISSDVIDENLSGMSSIEYSLSAGAKDGISNPEYLKVLNEFTQWVRLQDGVSNVNSYVDIIKQINKATHNDDPAFYAIPESRALAAQLLLLYEMSLPYGQDLDNMISKDKDATRVIVQFPNIGSNELLAFETRLSQWLTANAPESMYHPGASLSVTWGHLGRTAMTSSVEGTALALLLISMILAFTLRSAKWGALSLIPNMLPPGIGFGLWAILDGEIGLHHVAVLGITIGIIVDDTVHFLSKYLHAKEAGLTPEESIVRTFSQVGPALFITTVVLIAGFLLMSVSSFEPNSKFGTMISLIVSSAFLLDILLLPALILIIEKINPAIILTNQRIEATV